MIQNIVKCPILSDGYRFRKRMQFCEPFRKKRTMDEYGQQILFQRARGFRVNSKYHNAISISEYIEYIPY